MSKFGLKKALVVVPVLALGLSACQTSGGQQSAVLPGAALGGLLGAGVGSAITGDSRGAVIGAVIGAGLGAVIGSLIDEANNEAAIRNQVVTRTDGEGNRVTARPVRTYKKRNGDEIRVVRTTTRRADGTTQTVTRENKLVRSATGEVTSATVL
jgi:outer membrane lipoprotein SlyB